MTFNELLQQKMFVHHRSSGSRYESAFTLDTLLTKTKGSHIFFMDPELNDLMLGHVLTQGINIKVLNTEESYKFTYYSL